ncbi:hypothetical protein [Shewanella scandinavica]|uniref:Virion structural protein n=1 Tax=Shewanella scandinavica TaxID=3063538 RepID=A0ABU3G350_9GAMM|nr:hypothetical protein [Shewanella sp. SP2S1-2]MDT3281683.1 hypothetical protein [Shewanella sp. SP2S1-2]
MGLPVTVYRWDDAGAPQLSSNPTPSEIIAVLKACLVTGYGAKAGLGWSVAFEDAGTNKIAFRNSTIEGSGGFVQYWSPGGVNTGGGVLYLRAASSMSALDNFTHPSYQFTHYSSLYHSQWVIIGTSAGAYIIPRYELKTTNYLSSSEYEIQYFVGDIDSNYANDVTRFTICAGSFSTDTTSPNYSHALAYGGNSPSGRMYGVDGNSKANQYNIDTATIAVQSPNSNYTLESQAVNPVLLPAILRMSGTSYTDIDGLSCVYSSKNPYFRGVLPGLFALNMPGYGNATWPTERVFNGAKYQLLRGYFNMMWVNIEEWY